ncbi:MAG TPA: hemerythrin domain-containing protein [Terracidiphilus sp.]|nr:hemerythrin domain-containing protein [Terracidiphilus sp.]
MAIQIGAKPDSGFDDPIGMLMDCHRRIERFLHILCVVADRAQGRALTGEEAAALQAALHYFRVGGKRHTADEEESLFPRLRVVSAAKNFEELDSLENDHRNANDLHEAVNTLYSAWIAAGPLSPEDEQRLLSSTTQLKHLYEEHIQLEEKMVFPRAAEMLDSRTIATIGLEFHARRE